MRVTVQRIEPGVERSLVFAVGPEDRRVAFHLPRESGDEMQRLLDAGDIVQADLPDEVSGPLEVTSHSVEDVRIEGPTRDD